MARIYTHTIPLAADPLDAFCALSQGFTDQFVYWRKDAPVRMLGLGRCVAVSSMGDVDVEFSGPARVEPVFFSFKRFDAENPAPADEMFEAFPQLRFLLPEVVLIENDDGVFLQVNSLGPVYAGRVSRFEHHARQAPAHVGRAIAYDIEPDDRDAWKAMVGDALGTIAKGPVDKVVLSRRRRLHARESFSSVELLVNLIDGPATGTVFLYRYGDVFFCGCTPELLVRKRGERVESMCLAGTCGVGDSADESDRLGDALLADAKNLREHAHVVDFVRQVMARNCHDVVIPTTPRILRLPNVQHLYTPVTAKVMEGRSLQNLADQLHPTPALSGAPVGEALMTIRRLESFNRGFFGGSLGYVDAAGDGEFSVGIRSGVFDGDVGWLYAGCGIVEGSDADAEYDETDMKLSAILSAFGEGGL